MKQGKWIWKYKDFEFYHGMKYLLAREERGKILPAFYNIPHWSSSVRFRKIVELESSERIMVFADKYYCVYLDNERLDAKTEYEIPKGIHTLRIDVGNPDGICALKVIGESIFTDETWLTDNFDLHIYDHMGAKLLDGDSRCVKAASSPLVEGSDITPSEYVFPKNEIFAVSDKIDGNERIIDFGKLSSQIMRHQNYFAIIFGYADDIRKKEIINSVILNDSIPKITTPFFKFFECDVLCQCGIIDKALEGIKCYWGDMLDIGATTFWEEFDSEMKGAEHYAMYGEPFDKSLCHAWGAVPIYFFGKYIAGVTPTKAGYESFCVAPIKGKMHYNVKIYANSGCINVSYDGTSVTVLSDLKGGVLKIDGKEYSIGKNKKLIIS